jgi:hypothetical protein
MAGRRPRNPRKNSGQALKARRNVVPVAGSLDPTGEVFIWPRFQRSVTIKKTIPGPTLRFSPGLSRATVFRGNGAGSVAHYFVGTGAWGTG